MTSWKHRVKDHFGQVATAWATYYEGPQPPSRRHLLSRQRFALEMLASAFPSPATILDAGCGSGELAARLMDTGHAVWGVDFAQPMIGRARQLCRSDRFAVGDVEHIPFPDNTFDVVVSLGVLEYLEYDEQALREIWRVLKPGGRAVIAVSNGNSLLLRLDAMLLGLLAVVRPRARENLERSSQRSQRGRFSRNRWMRLLRDLSFEPEEWICHGWGWLRSPLGRLVEAFSGARPRFPLAMERATRAFVRNRAVNWVAAEHVFRARAIK